MSDGAPLAVRRCQSCKAEIVWAETERGRRMPVDVARSEKGNLLLYGEIIVGDETITPPYRVRVATADERGYLKGNLWTSHFATCPDAAEHRGAP